MSGTQGRKTQAECPRRETECCGRPDRRTRPSRMGTMTKVTFHDMPGVPGTPRPLIPRRSPG